MLLYYPNKKQESEILNAGKAKLKAVSGKGLKNKLVQGDNIGILKSLLDDYNLAGKVDLIYIDPPFATNGHFKIGEERANTISSSDDDQIAYSDILLGADFLEFLRERLILAKEVLALSLNCIQAHSLITPSIKSWTSSAIS